MSEKDSLLAQEQRSLIKEYQERGLCESQLSRLIKSFHGIAKTLAEKWQPSFPQATTDEIAAEADFATFLALKKFDCSRDVRPSTFFYRVMRTHIAKKWHHDRTRCVRMKTDQLDKTGRVVKLHLQQVSLNSYVDEHGDINELGHAVNSLNSVHLNDHLGCLEELCKNDLLVHRVVTRVIKMASSGKRRVRAGELLRKVADDLAVTVEDVERAVQTVKRYVDDNMLLCLTKLEKRMSHACDDNMDITDLIMKPNLTDVTEMLRWTGKL